MENEIVQMFQDFLDSGASAARIDGFGEFLQEIADYHEMAITVEVIRNKLYLRRKNANPKDNGSRTST